MAATLETVETVYPYSELSDRAKEKAREWWYRGFCEWNSFEDSAECVIGNAKRLGALMGIEVEEVRYRGFWSQGDGASFVGSYAYAKGAVKALTVETGGTERDLIRIAERLQAVQKTGFYGFTAIVRSGTGSNFCSHEHTVSIDVSHVTERNVGEGAEEIIDDCLRDFMRWIYRRLESEYEYQTGEEQIAESMEVNEYLFDEDGRIV